NCAVCADRDGCHYRIDAVLIRSLSDILHLLMRMILSAGRAFLMCVITMNHCGTAVFSRLFYGGQFS
ncbi:hypothetical protein NGB58_27210, partial [Escherichia coli]|nr:hypothetical protein [Escherichia coli]